MRLDWRRNRQPKKGAGEGDEELKMAPGEHGAESEWREIGGACLKFAVKASWR